MSDNSVRSAVRSVLTDYPATEMVLSVDEKFSCDCKIHQRVRCGEQGASGCSSWAHGTMYAIKAVYGPGSVKLCHAETGVRVLDKRFANFSMNVVTASYLGGQYKPIEKYVKGRAVGVEYFGAGYCYIGAMIPEARVRVARVLGPSPLLTDFLRVYAVVGLSDIPRFHLEFTEAGVHLTFDGPAVHNRGRWLALSVVKYIRQSHGEMRVGVTDKDSVERGVVRDDYDHLMSDEEYAESGITARSVDTRGHGSAVVGVGSDDVDDDSDGGVELRGGSGFGVPGAGRFVSLQEKHKRDQADRILGPCPSLHDYIRVHNDLGLDLPGGLTACSALLRTVDYGVADLEYVVPLASAGLSAVLSDIEPGYDRGERIAGLSAWFSGVVGWQSCVHLIEALMVATIGGAAVPSKYPGLRREVRHWSLIGDIAMKREIAYHVYAVGSTLLRYTELSVGTENKRMAVLLDESGLRSFCRVSGLGRESKGNGDLVEAVVGVLDMYSHSPRRDVRAFMDRLGIFHCAGLRNEERLLDCAPDISDGLVDD